MHDAAPPTQDSAQERDDIAARIARCVRSYWGFDELRPLQDRAIRAGLAARDSLVVLPTGGGKSLCYQVPPIVANRTDVVVSPLIALMKDQVDGLEACGYPAAAIHSHLSADQRRDINRTLQSGELKLLFVSPERLVQPGFLRTLKDANISSIAIDEAHCISQWGHDFRPEYRQLHRLRDTFPDASLHAFTASATPRVRDDIVYQLDLRDPEVLVGDFDRANLVYRIVERTDVHHQALQIAKRHEGEGVIIYCLSRKDTEAMAAALSAKGIAARPYHAGLSPEQRRKTQDAFSKEKLAVVAATVAFGMGIDRSNVRAIIHATMPKSVEHYQQETGRAGRDGLEAECVLLYSGGDAGRWRSLIERNADENDDSEEAEAAQFDLLEEMRRFCVVPKCRHRALCEYFGQAYDGDNCGACDCCLDERQTVEDSTVIAQKILACVARIYQRTGCYFGAAHVANVLVGANTEAIRERGHNELSTYGLLKGTDKKTIQNWIYQLVDQGLLRRASGKFPTIEMTADSVPAMKGERDITLIGGEVGKVRETRVEEVAWEGVDRDLFDQLRELRRSIADEAGVPAYVIFNDRSLRDMAARKPKTREEFTEVHGVGKKKLAQYGEVFLRAVRSYK